MVTAIYWWWSLSYTEEKTGKKVICPRSPANKWQSQQGLPPAQVRESVRPLVFEGMDFYLENLRSTRLQFIFPLFPCPPLSPTGDSWAGHPSFAHISACS